MHIQEPTATQNPRSQRESRELEGRRRRVSEEGPSCRCSRATQRANGSWIAEIDGVLDLVEAILEHSKAE